MTTTLEYQIHWNIELDNWKAIKWNQSEIVPKKKEDIIKTKINAKNVMPGNREYIKQPTTGSESNK